ncbi:hypothetical protein GQ42DRAFT_164094 [Ramicandelaber brevisporus]|nr:hypothetical protein GQ42DRAFT_164094 [Ramicandelaber brevisporus]
MGGHGHHEFPSRFNYHPPRVAFQHRFWSKLLGATMWLWIMYRAKEDGPVLLGWRHPWDHHGHGHGHGHAHEKHGESDAKQAASAH